MDQFVTKSDGSQYFYERESMWPGQQFGLQVKEILTHQKSDYQDIVVFDSTTYGRVLVLDGVIQLTERDEFAYQEMIVHLPVLAHPNPKAVLIVGAGDGGVLRELVKHTTIEKIVMCEIDKKVVDISKEYFGTTMATAFDDPRVTLLFMDAALYMKEHAAEFDVIIVDSSDPVGPAETLYTSSFYSDMRDALRPGGIVCTQGECLWLHLDLIERVMRDAAKLYAHVDYAFTTIPTYPSGQIGFILACKDAPEGFAISTSRRDPPAALQAALRYYSPEVHRAAFTLPHFAELKIGQVRPKPAAK